MSKGESRRSGLLPHILAILLAFVSLVFLLVLLLLNAPLPNEDGLRSNEAADRFWLLKISEIPPAADITGVVSSTVKYGFGNWGWCTWTSARGELSIFTPAEEAVCTTKAFWRLPRDADPGDPVLNIQLPQSIRVSLSIASFFIVLTAWSAFATLLALLIAIIDPPLEPQPKYPKKNKWIPPPGLSTGTWCSYISWNGYLSFSTSFFVLVWCLPTLIVVGLGISWADRNLEGYRADLGMGSAFLITAMVLLIASKMLGTFWGLYVNPRV